MVSSHQTRDLECFADWYCIPWNLPTNFHSDLIATEQQMSLTWLNALLFHQSHSFLICVVLTCNDSSIILHRTWQILRSCQCKWLLVSLSTPGTSVGSYWIPEKILFCTGRTVTTGLLSLVPQQRIDDYFGIHILHWELRDPRLSNHQHFTLWTRLYQYVFCKTSLYFLSSCRCHNFGFSWSESQHYAYPSPIPHLLATLFVIHEKNWKCLDVHAMSLTMTLQEHFHQPNSLWIPVANPADHAIINFVVLRRLHFYLCFRVLLIHGDSSLIIALLATAGFSVLTTFSCDEDIEEVGEDEVEELVDRPGTTNGT